MPESRAMKMILQKAGKIKSYFQESRKLTDEAAKKMDERYPAGWAQNPFHMEEMGTIRKEIKKSKKK